MAKNSGSEEIRQLEILEALEEDPQARQVDLASHMGVAVGTINWLLKRLASKGYVKIKRIGQWNWQYLLTPQGVAQKAKLTQLYLKESMRVYRQIRKDARTQLEEVKKRGFNSIELIGEEGSDLIDICRLTSLELDLNPLSPNDKSHRDSTPQLSIEGRELTLTFPASEGDE